ncbi:MAG TPA: proline dehydrogenase family protein [Conexibacter sp.]|jgi:proline dehydrogenase|nr:proline dehydrogenase family protein [Conexibacter sp.]
MAELCTDAPTADPAPPQALDAEILALGRRLARGGSRLGRARRAAHDRGMALVARDPQLRAALFRLVDVAPACAGPAELAEHMGAYLAGVERRTAPVAVASRAAVAPAARWAVGRAAIAAVRAIAGRFIVGETPAGAARTLRGLWQHGSAVSVDLLGESTVTPAEGRAYAARCDAALVQLAADAARWPAQPLLERDAAGALPRANLSVKVTALTPLVRAEAPERGRADAADLLRPLLRRARDVGAHLHVDMESMDSRELILDLVLELLSEPEFAAGPSAGIVLQAYLRDAEETLDRVLEWARASGRTPPLTIRLVKGAYWDHETIEAAQHGWVPPVWTEKAESDRCFERVTRRLIDAWADERLVRPAIASHNLRSVAHAVVYARHRGLAAQDLELQALRGLGDDLQDALVAEGLRGRTYCPVGDLVAGMAYLVRRLLENTSDDSFLASRVGGADLDRLLSAP